MPIFVQWKWMHTKTFLVIFHFIDDYSKPNLRTKTIPFKNQDNPEVKTTEMTWAPSHVEVGLLSDLLSYVNIINGLSETEKWRLKYKLQGMEVQSVKEDGRVRNGTVDKDLVSEVGEDKKSLIIFYDSDVQEWNFGVELCTKYIQYLRKLLKPYLR